MKSLGKNHSPRGVRKTFHTVERTFLLPGRAERVPLSSGRENLSPIRWYPSACVTRTARARRVRATLGRAAVLASGALGISSRTCADGGGERRTATKAPPAQMFRAVANSRNSLPFSSRVRTKIGMAKGSRTHWRRSFSRLRRIKRSPSNPIYHFFVGISWANEYVSPRKARFLAANLDSLPRNPATYMESHASPGAYADFSGNCDPRLENHPRVQGFSLVWQFRCLFR